MTKIITEGVWSYTPNITQKIQYENYIKMPNMFRTLLNIYKNRENENFCKKYKLASINHGKGPYVMNLYSSPGAVTQKY
jgi:hypothetical protein